MSLPCGLSCAPIRQPVERAVSKHRKVWVRIPLGAPRNADRRTSELSVPPARLRLCTALTYVSHAVALMERGMSLRSISMSTGISRATLHDWREHPVSANPRAVCPRCAPSPTPPEPQADYAYLLGLYLGDGCISRASTRDKDVWKLRIACADAWPGLRRECERAMSAVRPGNKVRTQQAGRLHRSDQLFAALAVPFPAARTGAQAHAENRAATMAAHHCHGKCRPICPRAVPLGRLSRD